MTDKARTINLAMYAACSVAIAASLIPDYTVINIGLVLPVILLIAAYILRSREEADTLVHHHMTYTIRTIWIFSLFASVGLSIAAYIIFTKGDQSAIDALMEQTLNTGAMPGEDQMKAAEQAYMATNERLMIESYIICMFPALLYFAWRVTRGAKRAYANYRLQNIYTWF